MKVQIIFIVILTLGLIACQSRKEEVTIIGKINGTIPEKVEYTTPIKGTWFYGSKQVVKPDSLGNFQITLNIDSPSFVTLYIPRKSSGILLVEPRETYKVNFNLNAKEKKFIVIGKNNKGQNIYNSFQHPDFHILSSSNDLLKDSIPSVISSKIRHKKEAELSLFTELFNNGEISKGFFKLAKLDRECYYAALEGEVTAIKSYSYGNNMPLTTPMLIQSPWFFALTDNYFRYSELKNESSNIENSKKYLTGNILEYYNAAYVYLNCWQNRDNSKELITLYEDFVRDYPNSEYTEYLKPMVTPIIEFHEKIAKKSSNDDIKFIENSKNINTLKECLKPFKGKKIYIDIWGTWCHPCKEEFQHKDGLNKLLKSQNMETLYICEGRSSKETVWKEMIQFYNLEGSHIMANQELLADIIEKVGRTGSFYYPYYILIDENGEIVEKMAKRPSQLKELEKQINESYVW